MNFYSTNGKAKPASFKEAVLKGLPEDNGLYMPEKLPVLSTDFIKKIKEKSYQDIGIEVASQIVDGEIDPTILKAIINDAYNFPVPVVNIYDNINVLELIHGPTLSFKDFGARFMARVMGHFLEKEDKQVNILVATSGDTGSAVAQGFYGVKNITVTLLYPKGKVSKIQEQQLTTVGGNVKALEIEGTFDDCQNLVKTAFLDAELQNKINLSSANSINISRLIPQSFYYISAYRDVVDIPGEEIVFCTPSGNFGNLSGGLLAKKMGLPVKGFIAATNANDIVPQYLETNKFNPRPSTKTLSNAMDVGNPSNFARLKDIYGDQYNDIIEDIKGISYTDEQTVDLIKEVYDKYGYVMCPHTAIGYAGLRDKISEFGSKLKGVFLSTASPAKFIDVVEPIIGKKVEIPERLEEIINRKKVVTELSTDYIQFKTYLLQQ